MLLVDMGCHRLAIIHSNNLPTMLRRLIGLYELGSMGGLLGLGIGITLALFQVLGKKPSCRRWLKRCVR
jgi:hypothetical protein